MNLDKKIMVELSGGVDSAATAYLLKEEGHQLYGVMMRLFDAANFKQEADSAKEICETLNIPFELVDLREEFKKNVIDYFIASYKQALTPNPCIVCNQTMKFGLMFDVAKKLGCNKIATGHYANIYLDSDIYYLNRAADKTKDQSYVLYFLKQEQLSKISFPLGKYTKDEVRKIAKIAGFKNYDKQDSQDICFIANNDYPSFILKNSDYKAKPGNVVDSKGNVLGQHKGLINYTIGQRKGLGLAFSEPMYVTSLNVKNNTVTLGKKEDTLSKYVSVKNFH